MTEARRVSSGSFVLRTLAPGRSRPKPGIVWLDRLSLIGARAPSYRPEAAAIASSATTKREGADTRSATVEVPSGSLVVDVRVGYGTATGALVGELRVVDLDGQRTSALVLLEGERVSHLDAPAAGGALFVDARSDPPGRRTFVSIEASVADRPDYVAVRSLHVHLTRG